MSNTYNNSVDEINGLTTGFRISRNGYCMLINKVPVSAVEFHRELLAVTSRDEATAALKDVLQAIIDTSHYHGWNETKRLAAASLATY